MRVPGLVIGTERIVHQIESDPAIDQVANVATLPGILGYSVAMPDIHWGYGFPIGGVAATDAEQGVISPGGVGYDINCGVRLAVVPVEWNKISPEIKTQLLNKVFRNVPSGVGFGHRGKDLKDGDYAELLVEGAAWSVKRGLGFEQDLLACESGGRLELADPDCVSERAKNRGRNQLGSIGSGNHFVEMGAIESLSLPNVASRWGLVQGQTYLLIHSGSRGLGHQTCQDTLDLFVKKGFDQGLPDKQLVCAPLQSAEGQRYFRAMCAAANFAFNNRQQILHEVREALLEVLRVPKEQVRLIYDVCHNIAKMETHLIDGKPRRVCVHRKGATRALGPGAQELAALYRETGQPVIVPGDMARASFLMVGKGNPVTFASACHGAGRAMSRHKSMHLWRGKDLRKAMEQQGVEVMATSMRTVAEEMPQAYKDVNEVVLAAELAGLADRVAKLRPGLVIKG
jgi:tRNA-splicing ligase RtcB